MRLSLSLSLAQSDTNDTAFDFPDVKCSYDPRVISDDEDDGPPTGIDSESNSSDTYDSSDSKDYSSNFLPNYI